MYRVKGMLSNLQPLGMPIERHNSFSFDNRLIGKNYATIVRRLRRVKWMCLEAEESANWA